MTRIVKACLCVLALGAAGLAASQTPVAERSAEDLRAQFKQLYLSLDTRGMESALAELAARFPQDASRSRLEFELGRLYAYSTIAHLSVMHEEALRAEQILKQFLPGGIFAAAPEAGQAQLEYAWFLLRSGRTEESRSLYGALAHHESPEVFTQAAKDFTWHFDLSPQSSELDSWRRKAAAMEERVMALPPERQGGTLAQLREVVQILKALPEGSEDPSLLMLKGRIHSRRADVAFGWGNYTKAKEEYRKIDAALTQWLAKFQMDPAKSPQEQQAELMSAKVFLAQAKSWEDEPRVARALLDEVLARPEALILGAEPGQYGEAMLWSVWTDRNLGLPPQAQEARLLEALTSGYLNVFDLRQAMDSLGELAETRGDQNARWAYLNDEAQFLPDPALALQAGRNLERFERERPETKNAPAGLRSEGLSRLISAGMVQPMEGVGRLAIFVREFPWRVRPSFQWVREAP